MIVRLLPDRIQLITQPDHARLARSIMERCVPLAACVQRAAILHAIGEHDNGWAEVDAAPMLDPDTGTIADFVHVPVPVRHAIWPRGVSRLAGDPFAAALVAQHAIIVYDRFRSDQSWTAFFEEMTAARDAYLHASGLPPEQLSNAYPFVRLGDLISLAFCTGWKDAQQFGGWTVRLAGATAHVSPDPFDGAVIPIEIEAREVESRTFRSDADIRAALNDAARMTLRGDVHGTALQSR